MEQMAVAPSDFKNYILITSLQSLQICARILAKCSEDLCGSAKTQELAVFPEENGELDVPSTFLQAMI